MIRPLRFDIRFPPSRKVKQTGALLAGQVWLSLNTAREKELSRM